MAPWPPHLYRRAGEDQGREPEVVERALQQANATFYQTGLPPILTLNHLASETDVPYRVLRAIVARRHAKPYRCFYVRKRAGGRRLICVPMEDLLRVQRWLVRHVLAKLPPHASSYAFFPGRSALECARMHCGCRWLIKIDVRQFFESISERQVYKIFAQAGYEPLIAFELTRLCTRLSPDAPKRYRRRRWNNRKAVGKSSIESYRVFAVGHLPQGAPTSPMLSNLAVRNLDDRLTQRAAEWGLVYTRYADDLIFSTAATDFTRERAAEVVRSVYQHLREASLRPRTAKTQVSAPGGRKIVLGMLVDREGPRLTREFRERLELHVFHLEKHGPVGHRDHRGFSSFGGMRDHIRGLLTHAAHVDPDFAAPLIVRFDRIEWPV